MIIFFFLEVPSGRDGPTSPVDFLGRPLMAPHGAHRPASAWSRSGWVGWETSFSSAATSWCLPVSPAQRPPAPAFTPARLHTARSLHAQRFSNSFLCKGGFAEGREFLFQISQHIHFRKKQGEKRIKLSNLGILAKWKDS